MTFHTRDSLALRASRHARLFALVRSEVMPDEDQHVPAPADTALPPDVARRLQQEAVDSLRINPESRWQQRIFRRNRRGSPAA